MDFIHIKKMTKRLLYSHYARLRKPNRSISSNLELEFDVTVELQLFIPHTLPLIIDFQYTIKQSPCNVTNLQVTEVDEQSLDH